MRIISKFKDYYDYLVGIYGIDPVLTLDRRYPDLVHCAPETLDRDKLVGKTFAIAGKRYRLYYYKDKVYYTLQECKKLVKMNTPPMSWNSHTPDTTQKGWDKSNGVPIKANIKYRNPVLMSSGGHRNEEWFPIVMSEWGLPKALSPEDAYREISGFMGYLVDHPPLPDTQTNIGKLEAHGFDKKISFRHRKSD